MDRKSSFRAALPLVLMTGLLAQTNMALADANGRAGRSGATTSTCASCHSLAASGTTVKFGVATGSFPTSVVANSVNVFTFTVSGGPAVSAGLDIHASGGTLSATGPGTKILVSEVVHSAPTTPFPATGVVYSFTWTAPAVAGTVTLHGAGVSGDGRSGIAGVDTEATDGTAITSVPIMVTAATPPPTPLPTASFTGPTTGIVAMPVTFDSTGSTGTNLTRNWNFGDSPTTTGVDATGITATHSYAAAGTYTVTLTLIDSLGVSVSTTHSIVISAVAAHVAPVANAGGPYMGTAGTAVAFNGSASTVSNGLTAMYSWDFGDGSALGTGATPSHTYAMAGTFLVKLTVKDSGTPPLSSTITANAVITAATTPPPSSMGQTLYDDNCASCHGPKGGPVGAAGSVVGESASDIHEAILKVPTMQSLSTLTAEEIAAIAAYLEEASMGAKLYDDNCASCHGPKGGPAGKDGSVVGESASDISKAILEVPTMQSLSTLTADEIAAIAMYLKEDSSDDSEGISAQTHSGGASTKTSAAAPTAAAGALDWLSLIGVGAWRLSRRRKQ